MKIKTFDVSGFGGGYEETCQRMIWNGVRFISKLKELPKYKEYQNVYGLCSAEGKEAEALDKAIMEGISDCTGAMHQCCVGHIMYIDKNGYDKWFDALKESREKDGQTYYEFEYTPDFVIPAPVNNLERFAKGEYKK